MSIPKDPVILLSFINTQLRDHFQNLEDLCKSLGVAEDDIQQKLKMIDYEYDKETNQFV